MNAICHVVKIQLVFKLQGAKSKDSSDKLLYQEIDVNTLEHGLTDPGKIAHLETILDLAVGEVRKQKLLKFFSKDKELLKKLGVTNDSNDGFSQNNVTEEVKRDPNASNAQLNQVSKEETESGVDANNGGDILKDPEAVEKSAFYSDGDSQSNDESIVDGVSNTGNIGKKNTDSSGKGDKSQSNLTKHC